MTLVNGVKLIDFYSFYQCYNLTDVTLNDGVLLKEGVFVECTKLEKIKLPDSRLTLQDFVEGKALFMHCTSLKSVEIPSHMTTLYELMFHNTGLEEFVVPDQVTSIGKYCFEACKKLKKLVLGKGIISLGKDLTFFVDDNLTLELSKNVRYIDPEAFIFANNVNVVIDSENPYYFIERNAVIERSSKTLITTFGKLPEIYRVPSSVEIVAEDAIKYINDYFKTKEFRKFSNERPAMIVILPETIKEFKNPTNLWTTITVCYEGEYFQSTKITNIPNKYADKKKYLNPSMFGENVNYDCSQKLPDNWRHVIGRTSLEKSLIISASVLAGLAVAAIIACIILYTLKSRTH